MTGDRLEIRMARADEVDRIAGALERHRALVAQRLAIQADGAAHYLIAVEADRTLGQAMLWWRRDWYSLPELHAIPLIEDMWVVASERSRGVGTRLLEAAEAVAAAAGHPRIGVAVNLDNLRARALYERLGYRDAGLGAHEQPVVRYDRGGRPHATSEMVIDLVKEIPARIPGRLADYHLGAAVYSSDGHHVGDLERMLVNQDDWEVAAVVVRETRGFSHLRFRPGTALIEADVVVPLSAVSSGTHDRVDLAITAREVRRLPPYLDFGPPAEVPVAERLTGYVVGITGGLAIHPLTERAHHDPHDIEVRAGENVMLGHGGDKFGQVDDLLLDHGELAGIVVKPVGVLAHDLFVPVRFLERSDDLALFIDLSAQDLKRLQRFVPEARG